MAVSPFFPKMCGWAAQQALSALQCVMSERSGSWTKFHIVSVPNGPYSIHWIPAGVPTLATSTISHKGAVHSGIHFFFLLPVLLLAAFNKANDDLVVHLTSP